MDRRTIGGPLLGILLVLAWLLGPGAASPQGMLEVRIDELNDTDFPVLRAAVTVTDVVGRPLGSLQADQFQASAGGVPLTVTAVQSAADNDVPIGLVLAFDVSGSMQGLALQQAREAGHALIGQLLPIDQVAVLAFAATVQVIQPFTADRDALLQAIDALNAGGDTALYEAVTGSGLLAASSGLPRRAVVLLSDGEEFGGRSTVDRAGSLATFRETGIPVFVVGLGDRIDLPYLQELTAAARSPLLLAPTPEELRGLYSRIGESLRHQFLVTVDAGEAPFGEPTFRLTVTHDGATAVAERSLVVPEPEPPPPPPPPPPPEPAVEPAQEAASVSDESGVPLLAVGAGGAAVLLVVAASGAVAVRRRRRQRRRDEAGVERRVQSLPPLEGSPAPPAGDDAEGAVSAPPVAQLVLLDGAAGTGSYPLGEAPATIGFASNCTIRLPDGQPHSSEMIRVWRRDGKFMLHRLSRHGRVAVGGRPVTWAVLEEGDEVEVGPYRLRFGLQPVPEGPPRFFTKEL